jgi:alkylation response protein AidB-like acyl-CoA dehydrogenase
MHRDRSQQIIHSVVTERQPLATMEWTMSKIPENLDALLPRALAAAALTEAGYPVSKATLATRATRGGGPRYRLYGRKPLYRWGDALGWARARLSKPVTSTSELDRVSTV